MDDSLSCGHPLKVARTDSAFVSLEILMEEGSRDHVGDSLEAPVRVIWETSWESDFEEVEHEEWIHVGDLGVADYSDYVGSHSLSLPLRFEY